MHPFGCAIRHRVQLLLADAEDSAVGVHPEIPKFVRNDRVNKILVQTLFPGDLPQPAAFETRYPRVLRRPDGAIVAFTHIIEGALGKPVFLAPVVQDTIFDLKNAVGGGQPDRIVARHQQVIDPSQRDV